MNLQELVKSWSGATLKELEESHPGPYLLIDWPKNEDPLARRVEPLQLGNAPLRHEVSVGRSSSGCDIAIKEAGVSSRHVAFQRLRPGKDSRWSVLDLCSTNGTFIDKIRLTAAEPEILEDDETILLGTAVYVRFMTLRALHELVRLILAGEAPPDGPVKILNASDTHRLNPSDLRSLIAVQREEASRHTEVSGDSPAPWPPRPESDSTPRKPTLDLVISCDGHQPVDLVEGRPVLLGRVDGVDLKLPHPLVSRRHAVFTLEDEKVFIEDLGSANGTVVETSEIRGRKVALELGRRIFIGPYKLRVLKRKDALSRENHRDRRSDKLRRREAAPEDEGPFSTKGKSVIFGGALSEMPGPEILQGIEFNERTGSLYIHSPRVNGVMVFKGGRPTFSEAIYKDRTYLGPKALYQLLRVDKGDFRFTSEIHTGDTNVTLTVSGALLEFSRLQDEASV